MDPIFGNVATHGPAHLQGVVAHIAPAAAADLHAPALTYAVSTARIALAGTPDAAYEGVHRAPRGLAVPKPLLDLLVRQVINEGTDSVLCQAYGVAKPEFLPRHTLPDAITHLATPAAAAGDVARRRNMLIWLNAGLRCMMQVAIPGLSDDAAGKRAIIAIRRLKNVGNAVAHPRVFLLGTHNTWTAAMFVARGGPAIDVPPAAGLRMPFDAAGYPYFPPSRVLTLLADHYGGQDLALVSDIVEWAAKLHECAVAAAGSPPPAQFAGAHPAWAAAYPGVAWAW